MRKKFYIVLRNRKECYKSIYYVRFCNDKGDIYTQRSAVELYRLLSNDYFSTDSEIQRKHVNTKTKVTNLAYNALLSGTIGSRPKAIVTAEEIWTEEEIQRQEAKPVTLLLDYCRSFWDFDTSAYIKKRIAEGEDITRLYAEKQQRLIDRHLGSFLESRGLHSLSLEEFKPYHAEQLKEAMLVDKSLSISVVNSTLTALRKPLKEAKIMGLLEEDIASLISNAKVGKSNKQKRRKGIPTEQEARDVLNYLDNTYKEGWYRYKYLIVALAFQTGMREAELVMLRRKDFHLMEGGNAYVIHTSRGYNRRDGEKTTKNGEERDCTCTKALGDAVLDYADSCPAADSYIFYSLQKPTRQLRVEAPNEAFKESLNAIGIDEEERQGRRISFHSIRHFHATYMEAAAGEEVAKMATGHKSEVMVKHYTNHQTEKKLQKMNAARERAIDSLFSEGGNE